MPDFTLQGLRDEIVVDLEVIEYKNSAVPADWKGDQVIADLGNAKTLVVDRMAIPTQDLRSAVLEAWYSGLPTDRRGYLGFQTPGELWPTTADMKLQLSGRTLALNGVAGTGGDINSFWTGAGDRAAAAPVMLALIQVPGSRFEVLWGEGIIISAGQVGFAFDLV